MFISTEYLSIHYGVDDKIARFFVDREPPADNLYWKGKLLYLRPAVGYLFIPLIVDVLYKSGIDKEQLLSEKFISAMEQIGHISALEETLQISSEEAINKCGSFVKDLAINNEWYNRVCTYFKDNKSSNFKALASPFKALHRGDIFLFSLAVVDFPVNIFEKIVEQWFALITTLLLLDDAEDLKEDLKTGEENAFVESGLNAEGFQKIKEVTINNLSKLNAVNKALSSTLKRQYEEKIEKPILGKMV